MDIAQQSEMDELWEKSKVSDNPLQHSALSHFTPKIKSNVEKIWICVRSICHTTTISALVVLWFYEDDGEIKGGVSELDDENNVLEILRTRVFPLWKRRFFRVIYLEQHREFARYDLDYYFQEENIMCIKFMANSSIWEWSKRPNVWQRDELINFMRKHPKFAKQLQDLGLWQELLEILHRVAPQRDIKQWEKTWNDLVKATITKVNSNNGSTLGLAPHYGAVYDIILMWGGIDGESPAPAFPQAGPSSSPSMACNMPAASRPGPSGYAHANNQLRRRTEHAQQVDSVDLISDDESQDSLFDNDVPDVKPKIKSTCATEAQFAGYTASDGLRRRYGEKNRFAPYSPPAVHISPSSKDPPARQKAGEIYNGFRMAQNNQTQEIKSFIRDLRSPLAEAVRALNKALTEAVSLHKEWVNSNSVTTQEENLPEVANSFEEPEAFQIDAAVNHEEVVGEDEAPHQDPQDSQDIFE
ncbi:hypothetical protein QAD02_007518 [Eretmocerus hayati]|uniref:Uncharacterized protein n=1 Tax=Eretmocerus hayati TaxID=131215 RepID=A0ACC2N460_9HYME|nr:hypothetical protein QAD02_007518 [Eretmocerus hayati]